MATELADGLYHVDCGTVNAYLVDDGDLTLVDAGTPGDAGTIRAAVAEAGHGLGDVDRVLVTHYDYDHVGALSRLTPALDAPVYAHDPDAAYVAGDDAPPWTSRKGFLQRLMRFRLSVPDLPVERVEDGGAVGGFTAYHTPGHTPGHTAFVNEAVDAALLGDLVREDGGRLSASPWFISQDTDAVRASIADLAERAPAFEFACPGHGEPLADGAEALARLA